ncbi:MAG TPA: magnesium transporter [Actinomycetota bacterium]|jgi:mgtE-like transporter|nr:magnesium transporter [Actinomycetota bacterium]
MARIVPRRAKRLWAYWRAEQRTLRQGFVALVLSTLASFVAGLTLSHITSTLTALPGLLVLVPAAVGMRGTIFGAIGARLGTSIHAGLFEPNLRRGGILQQNVEVAWITTLTSSLWLAALARIASAIVDPQGTISIWSLVTISVVGGALGSVFILLVTIGMSVVSYRRGYDLDAVGTPLVTALGDMATLPFLFVATYLVHNGIVNAIASGACVAATAYALGRVATTDLPLVRRIVLEMTPVILLTPLLDIAAGALLQSKQPGLAAVPAVLILIPPFVSQAGALGGILSSRLSSKLQLGVVSTRGWPEVPALVDGSLVILFGLGIFTFIGGAAFALAHLTGLANIPPAADLVGGTILAGLLILPAVLVVGYELAIVSARFGLDPDDHSVPIVTSVMDLAGVAAVLAAMGVFGVAIHG